MLVGGEVAEEAKGEVLGRVDNECAVGGRGRLVCEERGAAKDKCSNFFYFFII